MITAAGYMVTGLVLDADPQAATVELQATGRFAPKRGTRSACRCN